MKKIGILTFYNSYNYGAVLQAYATQKFLEDNNYEAKFINYVNEYENKFNKLFSYRKNKSLKDNFIILVKNICFGGHYYTKKCYFDFIKQLSKTKEYKNIDEIDDFDILISGSDQIWNPNIYGGIMDTSFLLDFKTNAKKISYASSFGSYVLNEEEKKIFKECLQKYSHISVREDFAINQLKELGITEVFKVCDPTMLISSEKWEGLIRDYKKYQKTEPYLVVYLVSKYEDYKEQIKQIANKYNLKIVFVSYSNKRREYVDEYAKGYNPFEFLNLIKDSNLVLTNSFHGTVFSLLFNKEFFNLENSKNPERALTLLKNLDLENRIIRKKDELDTILNNVKEIEYDAINKKIEVYSNESKKWLLNSID